MRIESASYLPVTARHVSAEVMPVQQAMRPAGGHREPTAARQKSTADAAGFDDAMMEVSVPGGQTTRIAMLYEVQRLAQIGSRPEKFSDGAITATMAYSDAMQLQDRRSVGPVLNTTRA